MDLHFQRRYPHSVERVWWALTDPALLSRWYMTADGLVALTGCRFTLHDPDAKGWSGWRSLLRSELPELLDSADRPG